MWRFIKVNNITASCLHVRSASVKSTIDLLNAIKTSAIHLFPRNTSLIPSPIIHGRHICSSARSLHEQGPCVSLGECWSIGISIFTDSIHTISSFKFRANKYLYYPYRVIAVPLHYRPLSNIELVSLKPFFIHKWKTSMY